MPRFDYVAITSQGRETKGVIDAADMNIARQNLRGRAMIPVSIELEGTSRVLPSGLTKALKHPSSLLPVRNRDKQFLFRQLALLVKSGVRLRASLEIVEKMVLKFQLARAIKRIIERIDKGESFAQALRGEGRMFPKHVPALVAAGEESGTLEHILDEVAVSMERAQELRNAVKRAVIMPAITLLVALVVLGFVVLWLVPILVPFLESNGGEVHWTMLMLLSLTEFLQVYGKMLAIVLGVGVFVLLAAYTTPQGKGVLDRALVSMPIFGRTIVLFEMSRFGGIGMLLIRSGLRQVEALRVLSDVTQNQAYKNLYLNGVDRLLEGQSMSDALKSRIFDRMARHMVRVGENSGSLEEVLDRLGDYFSDEVETRIRALISTMVPMITLIVGGVVAVIYLSVILTVLGAYTSVR